MFGEHIIASIEKRHDVSVTPMQSINTDCTNYIVICQYTGKIRETRMTGLEARIGGIPRLIANLAEATASLRMREDAFLQLPLQAL